MAALRASHNGSGGRPGVGSRLIKDYARVRKIFFLGGRARAGLCARPANQESPRNKIALEWSRARAFARVGPDPLVVRRAHRRTAKNNGPGRPHVDHLKKL